MLSWIFNHIYDRIIIAQVIYVKLTEFRQKLCQIWWLRHKADMLPAHFKLKLIQNVLSKTTLICQQNDFTTLRVFTNMNIFEENPAVLSVKDDQ